MNLNKLIKALVAIIVIGIFVVACLFMYNYSKHPEEHYKYMDDVKHYKIPTADQKFKGIPIPADAELAQTDGISFWQFKSPIYGDYIITKFITKEAGPEFNKTWASTDVILYTQFGGYSYSVSNDKHYLRNAWDEFECKDVEEHAAYKCLPENEIKELPDLKADDAVFSAIGVYNPPSFNENLLLALTADITVCGPDFFTVYQKILSRGDMEGQLLSWLATIDQDYDENAIEWYSDVNTFYAKSHGYHVGARASSGNNYAMFFTTDMGLPYLMMNLNADHPN